MAEIHISSKSPVMNFLSQPFSQHFISQYQFCHCLGLGVRHKRQEPSYPTHRQNNITSRTTRLQPRSSPPTPPCPLLLQHPSAPEPTSSGTARPRPSYTRNPPTPSPKAWPTCRRTSKTKASSKTSRSGGSSRSRTTRPIPQKARCTRSPHLAAEKHLKRTPNPVYTPLRDVVVDADRCMPKGGCTRTRNAEGRGRDGDCFRQRTPKPGLYSFRGISRY